MEAYTTGMGQRLWVHEAEFCAALFGWPVEAWCVIHKRMDTHVKDWPTNWRDDWGFMEVVCPHGIGHPAPEQVSIDGVHGCDGCCQPPSTPPEVELA